MFATLRSTFLLLISAFFLLGIDDCDKPPTKELDAVFLNGAVKTEMNLGERQKVRFKFENKGLKNWKPNEVRLVPHSTVNPKSWGLEERIYFPDSVKVVQANEGSVAFEFELHATKLGEFRLQWQLEFEEEAELSGEKTAKKFFGQPTQEYEVVVKEDPSGGSCGDKICYGSPRVVIGGAETRRYKIGTKLFEVSHGGGNQNAAFINVNGDVKLINLNQPIEVNGLKVVYRGVVSQSEQNFLRFDIGPESSDCVDCQDGLFARVSNADSFYGVRVSVDGNILGKTLDSDLSYRYHRLDLDPGSQLVQFHTSEIPFVSNDQYLPVFVAGDALDSVDVNPFHLGQIEVEVEQRAAQIYLNEVLIEESTEGGSGEKANRVIKDLVVPYRYVLRVSKEGYGDFVKTLELLPPKDKKKIKVSLEKLAEDPRKGKTSEVKPPKS